MQTKLLKYLFRGNNVELTANCTFDFIARVLIRTNSYKQTVNRWGARTARKWPAVFRPLGICNYANSASISISTRKAKATSSASRREPVVIFDREAAKASARPRVCLATKAKGFPFLTWKGRKCQDTWHNLSLIRFNAADIAIIVMHKALFMRHRFFIHFSETSTMISMTRIIYSSIFNRWRLRRLQKLIALTIGDIIY